MSVGAWNDWNDNNQPASQPASPFSYDICLSKHRGRRRRYGLSPPRPSPFETAVNLFDTLLLRCCSCSKSTNLTQYNTTSVYIYREREGSNVIYIYRAKILCAYTITESIGYYLDLLALLFILHSNFVMYRLIFSWNVRNNNNIVVVYISTGYKYKNIFPNYFWLKKNSIFWVGYWCDVCVDGCGKPQFHRPAEGAHL